MPREYVIILWQNTAQASNQGLELPKPWIKDQNLEAEALEDGLRNLEWRNESSTFKAFIVTKLPGIEGLGGLGHEP